MGTIHGPAYRFRLYAGDVDFPAHAHVLLDGGEIVVFIHGTSATLREIRGTVSDNDARRVLVEANDLLAKLKAEWERMHP